MDVSAKINIVVTDDHNLFRKGVCSLLSDFDFIGEINEAGNGIELLHLLENMNVLPDIILLDINMPEMDGVKAQKHVREIYPAIKIIVLTMEDDEQFIIHLINEGVNGYLLKNADPDEMEIALQKVMKNDFYFSDGISNLLLKSLVKKENTKNKQEELSEKELAILQLICREKTASEIADELILSVRTVEGYRSKLMEKTGSRNMAGLVIYAIKNNLVTI